MPKKVLKVIQSACRTFLWTGKTDISRLALVAWEKVCLPKAAEGLNIVDIEVWNKATVMKMFWNLALKKDVLWIKWVHA